MNNTIKSSKHYLRPADEKCSEMVTINCRRVNTVYKIALLKKCLYLIVEVIM